MFEQGMFLIDPNASPDQIKAQREALARLRYGRANNVGEGVGDLLQGFAAGIQKRGLNKAETSGRENAMASFKDFLSSGFGGESVGASPTVDSMVTGSVSEPSAPSVSNNTPIGKADPVQSVMDAAPSAQPVATAADWLKYANQGAVRNKPINPKLSEALGFLPELGVQMEVFSGGQPAKGSGKPRVGSTRHDHGNSADVFFYKDGRKLDWANPQDRPVYEEIVRRGKANGVTGFGAGDGYMRPGSMHLGFGQEAVWGAGGKGANAPDWLRSAFAGGRSPSSAAQAVNAMASQTSQVPQAPQQSTGGIIGTMLAGGFKQQPGGSGSAMDVWRGQAGQSTANDGSALQRLPDGSVKRTSGRYGYSEIMRPEGMPSERAPMPRQAQAGGIGSFIANALSGRGNAQMQQPAPMAEQAMTAPVMPVESGPIPAEVPQNQPPIPGIQPSVMQAAPQPAPQPVTQAPAQVAQAQPQGMDQQWLMQAMTLANNPFLPAAERATLQAIIEQRMQAADPMRQLEMDYKRAQLEKLRNPQADTPAGFAELQLRADAAGLQKGTPEYSAFMENGGGVPATFRALDMQAQAAGFEKGTPEYNEFMATRGAGLQAGAKTTAENLADIATGGAAEGAKDLGKASIAAGTAAWEGYGKVQTSLANIDEAISAIDNGANSGLVYNMLPSISESSAALENSMNRMGLDVVGSVTFGALSEGELRLAMSTAAPQNLQPPELRSWLVKRRAAQAKTAEMLANAARFLTVPGNTINGWIAKNKAANAGQDNGSDGWTEVTPGVRFRKAD